MQVWPDGPPASPHCKWWDGLEETTHDPASTSIPTGCNCGLRQVNPQHDGKGKIKKKNGSRVRLRQSRFFFFLISQSPTTPHQTDTFFFSFSRASNTITPYHTSSPFVRQSPLHCYSCSLIFYLSTLDVVGVVFVNVID